MEGFGTGEVGRVVYLGILGSALLVGLVSIYRSRPGTALRHGAIWALIFAGAVVLYGFGSELERQLMPRVAREVDADTIALTRSRDGQFHAEMQVEGVPVSALVDTGASELVLTREDAARIGLDPETLRYTQRAMTANGIVRGAPVRLGTVSIGPFTLSDVRAVVNGGELHTSLLGMSVLDRFAGFEVRGDRMLIHR